jgi:23S rRNA C2498 (ribose-2'-O)-methylase RlmM
MRLQKRLINCEIEDRFDDILFQSLSKLPMQSVSITTNVVRSNSTQAIQHYVLKFVSDLRQICDGKIHHLTE